MDNFSNEKNHRRIVVKNNLMQFDNSGIIKQSLEFYKAGFETMNNNFEIEINRSFHTFNDEKKFFIQENENILNKNINDTNSELKTSPTNVDPKSNSLKKTKVKRVRETLDLKSLMEQPKNNRFISYQKFDANVTMFKKCSYKIHFKSLMENFKVDQNSPGSLKIEVINSATVSDTIGFILYKIENLYPNKIEELDISKYSLYITDEEGNLEEDFPALDNTKLIRNYQFPELSIVFVKSEIKATDIFKLPPRPYLEQIRNLRAYDDINHSIDVISNHVLINWSKGQSTLEFINVDPTIGEIATKFFNKVGMKLTSNFAFYVESPDKEGLPLDLNNKLSTYENKCFNIHYEEVSFKDEKMKRPSITSNKYDELTNSFRGTATISKRPTEVDIIVSKDTVEFTILNQKIDQTDASSYKDNSNAIILIKNIISCKTGTTKKSKVPLKLKYMKNKIKNKMNITLAKEYVDDFCRLIENNQM